MRAPAEHPPCPGGLSRGKRPSYGLAAPGGSLLWPVPMGTAGDWDRVVGFLLGILPGDGATIASIASYWDLRNWSLAI